MEDLNLKKRVLEVAYRNKLSHLGSYFSALNVIDGIYSEMNKNDIFILSSGHAALALYAVLEKYHGISAEWLFKKHGGHPHRDEENHIYCSTGEENNIKNIKVYVNINGYAAYDAVDEKYLSDRLKVFYPNINLVYTTVNHFHFLKGLNAHYHVMNEEDYKLASTEIENAQRF